MLIKDLNVIWRLGKRCFSFKIKSSCSTFNHSNLNEKKDPYNTFEAD
jgi:hypothetical protein